MDVTDIRKKEEGRKKKEEGRKPFDTTTAFTRSRSGARSRIRSVEGISATLRERVRRKKKKLTIN